VTSFPTEVNDISVHQMTGKKQNLKMSSLINAVIVNTLTCLNQPNKYLKAYINNFKDSSVMEPETIIPTAQVHS
jgi:hypothetical protein